MKTMQKLRSKKGFTLIELIIVIVIIAILAAIAIPSIIGFTDDARRATAEANARTVYTAASAAAASMDLAAAKDIKNIKASEMTKSPDAYVQKTGVLLGTGFGGYISVLTADNAVTEVRWTAGKKGDWVATFNPITGKFTCEKATADGSTATK